MIVIPALDIRDGQCVRLLYGDYDRQDASSRSPARHTPRLV
ncbi:MAG: HisA/HisF-related TIM barrel protein, partial [Pseudomonadota bacterium]